MADKSVPTPLALPSTNLSMTQVAAELGISKVGLSLGNSNVRRLAGVGSSSSVSYSQLRGKSTTVTGSFTAEIGTKIYSNPYMYYGYSEYHHIGKLIANDFKYPIEGFFTRPDGSSMGYKNKFGLKFGYAPGAGTYLVYANGVAAPVIFIFGRRDTFVEASVGSNLDPIYKFMKENLGKQVTFTITKR